METFSLYVSDSMTPNFPSQAIEASGTCCILQCRGMREIWHFLFAQGDMYECLFHATPQALHPASHLYFLLPHLNTGAKNSC